MLGSIILLFLIFYFFISFFFYIFRILVIKINSQDTYGKSKYLDWAGAPFYLTPICSMDHLRVDREDSLGRQ